MNELIATSNRETQLRWTSSDLDLLPDNSNRYEIIDGELFVTRAPHNKHQDTCGNLYYELKTWSKRTGLGYAVMGAGVLFSEGDDVIPDVIWMQKETYTSLVDESGHFRGAPELAIEVLSAGTENERRDRQVKLKLYSSRGVLEYWIANWRAKQIEVYRRKNGVLKLELTLLIEDVLTSPFLPEFACPLSEIFIEEY
ncbi:MAG: Uma2 family endonuclease [Roseofilum sp. SBFL]|uniref:Uma2 family endonuclease n=1 Tax=unclassified Roseofilum TaxID=2620099 RepID=UPI001B02B862|nr:MULTISPECIES: Uma2 family endonuclease [unclassified Roseofilum]MBP0013418.1 Uma2 family endonuclease [Roseofilum sp. SID3]MBP0022878.1 Uma2 family endonuclease [Roseofilum sp. SID2]MBP0036357.1 Uma2 family endonuclease [Roseofilum sp. SID1]MBP0043201.1 Uma2 family endonuclease [Roseofilum sp. SBFL]